MTITEIETLPIGTMLWYTHGKITVPAWLATKKRNSWGKILISDRRLEGGMQAQRTWVLPRQLQLDRSADGEYGSANLKSAGKESAALARLSPEEFILATRRGTHTHFCDPCSHSWNCASAPDGEGYCHIHCPNCGKTSIRPECPIHDEPNTQGDGYTGEEEL